MQSPEAPRGRRSWNARAARSVALACLVGMALAVGAPGQSTPPLSTTLSIDFLYPEAFIVPTWVDVPLPSDSVTIRDLRILTGNRSWTMKVCELRSDPATCLYSVDGLPGGGGWRGDYSDRQVNHLYLDREGTRKLHLLVNPVGGDWMIFRIQVEVEAP